MSLYIVFRRKPNQISEKIEKDIALTAVRARVKYFKASNVLHAEGADL